MICAVAQRIAIYHAIGVGAFCRTSSFAAVTTIGAATIAVTIKKALIAGSNTSSPPGAQSQAGLSRVLTAHIVPPAYPYVSDLTAAQPFGCIREHRRLPVMPSSEQGHARDLGERG